MKQFYFILFLFLTMSALDFDAQIDGMNNIKAVNNVYEEISPQGFKDYAGSLLIQPAFDAIGTTKSFSKKMDKCYLKPYKVAEYDHMLSDDFNEMYPIENFQYMVVVQRFKDPISGSSEYSFYLVDRLKNDMYVDSRSGNMFKKYIKKLMEN